MTASIEIVPTSCLDWPSSPTELPKSTILIGSPSYLAYASRRRDPKRTPLSQFIAGRTDGTDQEDSTTVAERILQNRGDKTSSSTKSIDLTELTPAKLADLNHYQILGGIKMHSTAEQIKRAFHRASLKYHPDKQEEKNNANNGANNAAKKNKDDGTKTKQEDPIFLRVKEAFETLGGDPARRKAYDSTINFDESVPSAADIGGRGGDFYKVFGRCFERNLRFAVENDPSLVDRPKGGKGGGGRKGGKGRGGASRGAGRSAEELPRLGNAGSDIADVNEFYEYWIHFESWRDFTIPAMEHTEHDVDNLELCRFQKRAMEQEIARKAKSLKKEEMARITRLVERSMALDPRLKKEKERLEEEKLEKVRQKKLRLERIEDEKREKEETEERERADREREEKEERVRMKAKRDQEKKILRKSRQSLRKILVADEMKDDIEFLCERLNVTQIDDLTQKMSTGGAAKHQILVQDSVNDLKEADNQKVIEENRKREARRQEAVQKEAAAKAARASKPWTKEELSAIIKAVKKYPAGGANRWETIAGFVNNLCKQEDPRSKEQCIEKYNQITTANPTTESSSSTPNKPNKNAGEKATARAAAMANNAWTEEQIKQLQKGLSKFPGSMEKNERWVQISKGVSGKTKKECVQRFKVIRATLKRSK